MGVFWCIFATKKLHRCGTDRIVCEDWEGKKADNLPRYPIVERIIGGMRHIYKGWEYCTNWTGIPLSPLWIVYKELIFNLVDFFYAQKVAPKMHRPRFYALLRAFFKLHISHTSYPIFSFRLTARNVREDYIHSFIDEHEPDHDLPEEE